MDMLVFVVMPYVACVLSNTLLGMLSIYQYKFDFVFVKIYIVLELTGSND